MTRERKREKSPDVATGAILARIVREHGKAYAPQYAVAFCFMAVASACTALTAWMMKDVVNRNFVDRDSSALIWVAQYEITSGLAVQVPRRRTS